MANKATVFNKIKDLHYKAGSASPQILVSLLIRELQITREEAMKHLDILNNLQLIRYKGASKNAVEMTKSGLTTNLSIAAGNRETGSEPEQAGSPSSGSAGTPE